MEAALMTGIRTGQISGVKKPNAGKGEVVVEIKSVGICGSDLHLFANGRSGSYIVPFPYILGHESAGVVTEVGDGVSELKIGDRVALEPGKTCGKCEFCKTGRYNLCNDVVFFSAPPYNGVFCQYVAHPADLCFRLPDNMSFTEGALIEPLAVGMHAVRQAGALPGQSAVVIGLGCIGLVTIMALQNAGINKIFAVDVAEKKLEFARNMGVIPIDGRDSDTMEQVMQQTNKMGADMVFETAGTPRTTAQTVYYAKKGGAIVLVGMTDQKIEYDFFEFICRELTVKSVFRYRNLYPSAMDAVSSGKIDIQQIVTHTFDFCDTFTGLNTVLDKKDDVIKAVILMERGQPDNLDTAGWKLALLRAAQSVIENEAQLCELDGYVGDGDHGMTAARGFRAAKEYLQCAQDGELCSVTMKVGEVLGKNMGGAIGPIFQSIFDGMSEGCEGVCELNTTILEKMFSLGLQQVKLMGGAKEGDKTLVDSLSPACDALAQAKEEGLGAAAALRLAAEAAHAGCTATTQMTAKKGRAKYLKEKSIGHQDAGATTMYIMIQAIADSMND